MGVYALARALVREYTKGEWMRWIYIQIVINISLASPRRRRRAMRTRATRRTVARAGRPTTTRHTKYLARARALFWGARAGRRSDIRRWHAHGSDIRRGKPSHGHGYTRAGYTRALDPPGRERRARAIAAGVRGWFKRRRQCATP